MKPKIGRVVYTVSTSYIEISEETVGYLGKNTFLISNHKYYDSRYEFDYNDYGTTWFTSFDKAKAYLKKVFKGAYPNDKFNLECVRSIGNGTRFWRLG